MRLVVANGGSQPGYVGGTPRSTLLVMEVTEGAASIRGLLPFLPFLYASFSSFFSFLLSFSLYEPPPYFKFLRRSSWLGDVGEHSKVGNNGLGDRQRGSPVRDSSPSSCLLLLCFLLFSSMHELFFDIWAPPSLLNFSIIYKSLKPFIVSHFQPLKSSLISSYPLIFFLFSSFV